MPRPLCDSPYIFGIHEEGGEKYMLAKGKPGWIVFTEELGADPNNRTGRDYRRWSDQNLGVIVRLNHGYEPNGTIPHSSRYADFAQRCANFVAASRGAHIWIIGNEPNLPIERPGGRTGEVITPQMYARCYRLCREAIKQVPGHENDQVCVAAIAPWNNETTYPGNSLGDWVVYFQDVLRLLGPDGCDAIALHTYTHGADPNLIFSTARMGPPFQHRYYHFFAYRDFMEAIPASMRHLPVYITETNQNDPWADVNSGWVRNAYAEIHWWNQQPGNQQIRLLALYRWPARDWWVIEGKRGVIEDFLMALDFDYRWREQPERKPYQAKFLTHSTPAQMVAGATYTVRFRIRNDGGRLWKRDGTNPVRLGFHWFDRAGQPVLLMPEHDIRSELPSDVAPGETAEVDARVVAPAQPGSYVLEWDLVEEGITWFRDQGNSPLTVPIEVMARPARMTGRVERPQIEDVISRLSRDPAGFVQRPLERIRYLVFSHTAVPATVSVERLAAAHRERGLPGFAGQYLITGDGRILQTQPLTEVVSGQQTWSMEGVTIYVAGNFMEQPPAAPQLDAAARLSAWLLQELNLPEAAIVGMSELTSTLSPGTQWLQGARWKDLLLQRVRDLLQSAPAEELAQLRARVAELQAQLAAAQSELGMTRQRLITAEAQIGQLQRENTSLRRQLDEVPLGPIPRPALNVIVDELPKSSDPNNVYGTRFRSAIKAIVVHHTAVPPTVGARRVAEVHVNINGWPGIGYHFFVNPDGTIEQTNWVETVSAHTRGQNAYSVGVAFAGDFTNTVPTPEQIERGGHLIAWLMQQLNVPLDWVRGHKEMPNQTTACPGDMWLNGQKWKEALMRRIQEVQAQYAGAARKTIEHYLLFWWRSPDFWARQDWMNATNYIQRFRPACGFRVEDAMQAQYVTIVGGVAGVSAEDEQRLRAAGCKVERLAGANEAETKAMLDELAASGRRFRTLT